MSREGGGEEVQEERARGRQSLSRKGREPVARGQNLAARVTMA